MERNYYKNITEETKDAVWNHFLATGDSYDKMKEKFGLSNNFITLVIQEKLSNLKAEKA
jgi:hypothetical protein